MKRQLNRSEAMESYELTQTDRSYDPPCRQFKEIKTIKRLKRNRTSFFVLSCCLGLSLITQSTENAYAYGDRPLFQAPFSSGQVWDAWTYCNEEDCHSPDPGSIDLAMRDHQDENLAEGQPALISGFASMVQSSNFPLPDNNGICPAE